MEWSIGISHFNDRIKAIILQPNPPRVAKVIETTHKPIGEFLQKMAEEENIKFSSIVTGIDSPRAILKYQRIPKVEKSEINELLVWEARLFYPQVAKDFVLDFSILKEKEKEYELLKGWVPRDEIEKIYKEYTGFKPIIDTPLTAFFNALDFNGYLNQNLLGIHSSGKVFYIIFCVDKEPILLHRITSEEEPFLTVKKITRSIKTIFNKPISKILISGDVGKNYTQEKFDEIEVSLVDPFSKLKGTKPEKPWDYTLEAGYALRGVI